MIAIQKDGENLLKFSKNGILDKSLKSYTVAKIIKRHLLIHQEKKSYG